jgi:hypothetical protein
MEQKERMAKFRLGLSSLYLPFYDALCKVLPEEWQPYYGLRSFNEQTALWNHGRSVPGKIVTNAKGGESPHNYGCASDWTLWLNSGPVWMDAKDPRWKVYVDAIKKVGLRSGSTFSNADYPHNELSIDCSWKHVAAFYAAGGMIIAMQHIEENLSKR